MSDIYKQKIVDHYKNPRNFKKLEDFTHKFKVENLSCGDSLEIWLRVDDSGTIEKASFEADGCVITLASGSMLTEKLIGKTLKEVSNYDKNTIVDMLGIELQPSRLKCALLSLEAAQKALSSSDSEIEQLN